MSEGPVEDQSPREAPGPSGPTDRGHAWSLALLAIVVFGSCLRIAPIGRTSLWYDEVVTMRLARCPSPSALIKLLDEIDATRAPLHPLLLQRWVAAFGPSDQSGRAFSILCGTFTIVLVFWVGTLSFDRRTGVWSAWLASVSPLLVYYAVEVRMYSWLVMATCLSWGVLFSFRRSGWWFPRVVYPATLVGLIYSHPLGLLMAAALGLASLANRAAFRLSIKSWSVSHALALLAILPWLPRYLDHPPEATSGRLSLTFLLGFPIPFIGGNFAVLIACALIILGSLWRTIRDRIGGSREDAGEVVAFQTLFVWLLIPPVALYVYSRLGHPIFGPPRYTLFVAPAFLILLARGVTGLPRWPRCAAGASLTILACLMVWQTVYPKDRKADWRGAAAYLDREDPSATVVVVSADPSHNAEVETARYYLGARHAVVAFPEQRDAIRTDRETYWLAVGLRDGQAVGLDPPRYPSEKRVVEVRDFPGLRLLKCSARDSDR